MSKKMIFLLLLVCMAVLPLVAGGKSEKKSVSKTAPTVSQAAKTESVPKSEPDLEPESKFKKGTTPKSSSKTKARHGRSNDPIIKKQVPYDANAVHCDIHARNKAIDFRMDPRGQDGFNWDGNEYTVAEIYEFYPNNRKDTPEINTSGYGFWSESGADTPEHMEFYTRSYNQTDGFTQYVTKGVEEPVPTYKSIKSDKIKKWTFVALPKIPISFNR